MFYVLSMLLLTVRFGVLKNSRTALGEVLERDSRWAVDKLTQYSEGVSDAHVSRLAAAMRGEPLAPLEED